MKFYFKNCTEDVIRVVENMDPEEFHLLPSREKKIFRENFFKCLTEKFIESGEELEPEFVKNLFSSHPYFFISNGSIEFLKKVKSLKVEKLLIADLNELTNKKSCKKKIKKEIENLQSLLRKILWADYLFNNENADIFYVGKINNLLFLDLHFFVSVFSLNLVKRLELIGITTLRKLINYEKYIRREYIAKLKEEEINILYLFYYILENLPQFSFQKKIEELKIFQFLPNFFIKVFKNLKIKTVEDLINLKLILLKEQRGIGRKKINKIRFLLNTIKLLYINRDELLRFKEATLEKNGYEEKTTVYHVCENINDFVQNLDKKEKIVFIHRFLFNKTFMEIAPLISLISRERVRQIESKILTKLKKSLLPNLIDYVETFGEKVFLIENKENLNCIEILKRLLVKLKLAENLSGDVFCYDLLPDEIKDLEIKGEKILYEMGIPISLYEVEKRFVESKIPTAFLKFLLTKKGAVIDHNINEILHYKKMKKVQKLELIMKKLRRPVEIKVLKRIYENITGEGLSEHNIESILYRSDKCILIGPKKFQLTEFFMADVGGESIAKKVVDECHFFLLKNQKWFSSSELLKRIKENIEVPNAITHHALKGLLELYGKNRFLFGKKLLVASSFSNVEVEVNYEEVILNIFENISSPIDTKDFYNVFKEKHHISFPQFLKYFYKIQEIVKVDRKRFFTMNKLGISSEDVKFIVKISFESSISNGFPLGLSYIEKVLIYGYSFSKEINRYVLSSILKRNEKFRVLSERLVSIKDFEDKYNFGSVLDIILHILKKLHNKATMEEIISVYKNLTKDMDVSPYYIYNILDRTQNVDKVGNFYVLKDN